VDTPRPSPRTNRTRRVPHPILIGHAASLTPCCLHPPRLRAPRRSRGLPSCVPSRCPGRRSLVQSGPRSLAENGSKGPWQREPPARAARASRAPRPAPARRSLPTSSAAARSRGARCAPSSCVPSSCVPSPEGGPLSHGAGPNASRARRGVALPGAAAGGMAPWSHLHRKPPAGGGPATACCGSCCQQRECTVGTWVGATVGRGGWHRKPPAPR